LRQDFSPILQAAQAQAQATQQAAAIRAQSLSQLGQTVAQGIQTYAQNQEKKKQEAAATNMVAGIFKANPFLAKSFNLPTDQKGEFDKGALKEFIKVSGGPGQAVQLASGLEQMTRARQQQEKELADRARLDQFLTQTPAGAAISGGTSFENLPTGTAAFLPRQFGNAQELLVAGQRAGIPVSQLLPVATGMASLGKTEAEAAALRAPKPEKAPTGAEADVQALVSEFSAVNGRPPNATEYRMMRQSVNAERKPSNVTNIGSGFAGQLFTDLNKKKSDLFALREVLANYDTAIDEVSKNGLFAGHGGELKFQGARALQSFGIDAYKTEAEAYQAAGSALANSTLSMARMLPGAFTENELIFLNDVVRGRERVPSLAALKQLRARFESRLQRQQKILDSEVTAFGEGAKDDPNIAIGYRILTAKPSADMPSLPPNF
jgi:hypothetical protein